MNQQTLIPLLIETSTVVVCVALVVACSTAAPTGDAEIEAIGEHFFVFRGAEIEIALGTGYADGQRGAEFLLLGASFAGANGEKMTRVDRKGISVRTPDQRTISMLSQEAFLESYGRINTAARFARAFSPTPLDSRPTRRPCGDWFFRTPLDGLTRDVLTISSVEVCDGILYFQIPGGVRPGRWVFEVNLGDSSVEIPFDLD